MYNPAAPLDMSMMSQREKTYNSSFISQDSSHIPEKLVYE
jgi:hypothetical protein